MFTFNTRNLLDTSFEASLKSTSYDFTCSNHDCSTIYDA